MCGISGALGINATSQASEAAMNRMLEAQHHRGPDARAFQAADDAVLLGHNRLSILDLSAHANQPMTTHDGRFHMVFNGEIYNYLELRSQLEAHYTFVTSSDSEVLLYAFAHWGLDCLNKLNGMFAFAIYDTQRKQLTLARDRFGVKPVHYAYDSGQGAFVFASEIKALHAYGVARQPNAPVWSSYLSFGHYHYQEQTFWEGVFTLPAGHYAQIEISEPLAPVVPKRWYDFAGRIKTLQSDEAFCNRDAVAHQAHYKALLEQSVSLRFRSDVPVGFNISGGVDSSTLLGAVNQLHPNSDMQAFSFYTNDERYDEIEWVERVIAKTNKPLNKVLLCAQEVPELSQALMSSQDEPYGGIPTIAYSRIFQAARDKGVIVLLDGQGMDEAWAGYDYYHGDSDAIVQGVQSSPFKPEVLNADFAAMARKETYDAPFEDALLNKQYRDLFYTKLPRALRFNDRLSMMYSTELREPFLDYRLVEYAFAQPLENKLKQTQTKWMLRQIANDYLQDELTLAPKRPLQTPQREWLSNDLLPWVESQLEVVTSCPWMDTKALQREWDAFKASDKDNTFFLWQWISLAQIS